MPSVTRFARDIAAKVWPGVTARSRQGWQWLKTPIAWAVLRARLIQLLSTYAGVGIVLLLLLLLLLALPWYAAQQKDEKGVVTYPNASLINPILGGLGALLLIYAAIRQARTATEVARTGNRQAEIAGRRHVTDTFSNAVEQLSSEQMEVRVGGIYTLERLAGEALDSERDADKDLYWTAMETLTAFVRERARWQAPKRLREGIADKSDYLWPSDTQSVSQPDEAQPRPEPATDVAAVITVIRRRPEAGREREQQRGWCFDFRATDLRGAYLSEVYLEGAYLSGAHLEHAVLAKAHLEGARLSGAHLERALLAEAHLEGASLERAHLERAGLPNAHLEGARLSYAHLERAFLRGAHLERAVLGDAHLKGAFLRNAHLERAGLSRAHLEGSDLRGAHFERVDLRLAHLEE